MLSAGLIVPREVDGGGFQVKIKAITCQLLISTQLRRESKNPSLIKFPLLRISAKFCESFLYEIEILDKF